MKHDCLLKCLSNNNEAVVYALDATELLQESMERLLCWPPATKHLGQAMMASILLQALTEAEDNETVSLQWSNDGPFGHLFTEARNFGQVRGTIQKPQPAVTDYETGMGEGVLQVRRSRGPLSRNSIVNSIGDVSTDIVEYLEKSEQRSCGLNLSVHIEWDDKLEHKFRVRSALAYLVHILPQPTEAKMNDALLRWDRQMLALGPISRWQLREESVVLDMLRLITLEQEPKVVMNQRIQFHCNCTEERAARALALLEAQEKKEGKKQQEPQTELKCEYCGRKYLIRKTEEKMKVEIIETYKAPEKPIASLPRALRKPTKKKVTKKPAKKVTKRSTLKKKTVVRKKGKK